MVGIFNITKSNVVAPVDTDCNEFSKKWQFNAAALAHATREKHNWNRQGRHVIHAHHLPLGVLPMPNGRLGMVSWVTKWDGEQPHQWCQL